MASFLLFLLTFTISTTAAASTSKTSPEDTKSLQLIKSAIDSTSITPSSCLSSWDFTFDPCSSSFGNHFTCGIRCDVELLGFSRITEITLDPAGYSGFLSPSIWSLPYLQTLDLSENNFTGNLPSPPPHLPLQLRKLALSSNSFWGEIPNLSPASSLEALYLDNNFFSGSINSSFTSLTKLQRLDLQMNNLSGAIPDLTSLSSLSYFDASNNVFTGGFPKLPSSLIQVSIRNNKLTGTIPGFYVAELVYLQVMDMSHNSLTGSIPKHIFEHPALEQVSLSYNKLVAIEEPDNVIGSKLVAVDFGSNLLGGFLPEFLGEMRSLTAVDLGENRFTGMIPVQYAIRVVGGLEGMVKFGRMILAGNYLFGPIPSPMGGMEEEGAGVVSLADNCLFRCPAVFFFCGGGKQKEVATCREFNPVIP